MLAVSTDPAHSLGDAFRSRLSEEPSTIQTRRGTLLAAEIAADSALSRWRRENRPALRELAARGTYLDEEDVERFLDLALPGADELIAWLEIDRLALQAACDEVVVDAAPTAHTLRLLASPEALRGFAEVLDRLQEKHRLMAERFGGVWRPDASAALIAELENQGRGIEDRLRDPQQTSLRWVMLAEALALAETLDTLAALDEAGLVVREVIVNRVLPPDEDACPLCRERRAAEAAVIGEIRRVLAERELRFVPQVEAEPRGKIALRKVAGYLESGFRGLELIRDLPFETSPPGPLSTEWRGGRNLEWMDELAPPGLRLLFFGGKGGVGKTTCAAAFALALAERRPQARILLLSTDPAHSIADALEVPLGDEARSVPGAPPGLRARELDARRAFAAWRERHGEAVGEAVAAFTAEGAGAGAGELVDLSPPGLDELIALAALLDAAVDGEEACDLVIVDTAPTGHALRLLEMPDLALAWDHYLLSLLLKYREAVGLGDLAAELVELSRSLKRLQALLRDAGRARFLVVTRAAELPRRETVRLLRALRKLHLTVPAVIVNAVPPPGCARCGGTPEEVQRRLAGLRLGGCVIMKAPAVFPPPRGVGRLAEWVRTWETTTA